MLEPGSWAAVDAELDSIEDGDVKSMAEVFLRHEGRPIEPCRADDRWTRVTVSSFARHVGLARHVLNKWVLTMRRETA